MLGAFRSADAGPRGAATRIGLAALLACIGLTWTAGATSAFATYGTVKITKVNEGGDQTDSFHFNASTAIKSTGGFDLKGGQSYSSSTVHANTGAYAGAGAYTVSETADDRLRPAGHRLLGHAGARQVHGVRLDRQGPRQPQGQPSGSASARRSTAPSTTSARPARSSSRRRSSRRRDTGKFDLQVDGENVATQVGDGGYGSKTVTTGSHTVGEAGTYLSNYIELDGLQERLGLRGRRLGRRAR